MSERVKNPVAVALGKLALGIPKQITEADRLRRRNAMLAIHAKRKAKKIEHSEPTSILSVPVCR